MHSSTGVDFSFKDPERGFDRARVKGVVARLVRVKDAAATTALEVAAGGKLYQVHCHHTWSNRSHNGAFASADSTLICASACVHRM